MVRKGFRWTNNTLVWLAFFSGLALLLHLMKEGKPIGQAWTDLKKEIAGSPTSPSEAPNPYKTPEPDGGIDSYASDVRMDSEASDVRVQTEQVVGDALPIEVSTASQSSAPTQAVQKPKPRREGFSEGAVQELRRVLAQRQFFYPAYSSRDQLVRRIGYTLNYNEPHEQAAWVAYPLTAEQIRGDEERDNIFMNDPIVKTGSAVTADYTKSGYDRGHLAPAADFRSSFQVMKETFYMSNISPQVPEFNRGIWSDLERMVRVWAQKYDKVYVVTGPVLRPRLPKIGRINKVSVPEYFYKVILYAEPPYVKGIAFLLKNEASAQPLSTFVVSIDEVEKLTGIDFFPQLPDEIERVVEAKSIAKEWYRLK